MNQSGERERNEITKRKTYLSNIDMSELSSLFRHLNHNRFSFVRTCDGLYVSYSRIFAIFLQTPFRHQTPIHELRSKDYLC